MRMLSRLPYCSLVSVWNREQFGHSSIGWGVTALSLATSVAAQNPHRKGRSMKPFGTRLGSHVGTQAGHWFPYSPFTVHAKRWVEPCSSSSETDPFLGFGASPDSSECLSNQSLKLFKKFITTIRLLQWRFLHEVVLYFVLNPNCLLF